MYDPEFYATLYTNVLVDVDSFKHHHDKHKNKDVYDLDPTSVSPYDAMDVHKPATNEERRAWFKQKAEHDEHYAKYDYDYLGYNNDLVQKGKMDAYDHDANTASPYDAGNNINGGNVYGIKSPHTDNDTAIGPKEKDLIAAIKKGYWWDKELEKELARPAGAGQGDAREGYGGAIPYKNGKLNCDAVGASCEAPPKEEKSAEEKKADADDAKKDDETKKAAEEAIEEGKAKAAKAEEGKGPETEAAPAEKAAFAQVHRKF